MARNDLHDAPLEERVAAEQEIWDRERDRTFADPSMLEMTYPSYESLFDSYPEYRFVRELFGPSVAGKRVLEVGCGAGVVSVALALGGATVTAVDVSASGLRVTRERAERYGVGDRIRTVQGAAEQLDMADGSFDLFFAKAVVHHLLIDDVMERVRRLLAPAGRGAIIEPQSNPVLDFAREHLPYPGKVAEGEHGTDVFFTPAIIRQVLGHFDYGDWRPFCLLSMAQQFIGKRGDGYEARRRQEARIQRVRRVTDAIDARLMRLVPAIGRLAQLTVLRFGLGPVPETIAASR
jgi:2-polyprenyl-3-methyl-5-hydroxy-6-metoxy-1,4-benzoquinol methylase